MRFKQSRYYEIDEGFAYVYDKPYKEQSLSVSVVKVSDLTYYRVNFNLQKVWNAQ